MFISDKQQILTASSSSYGPICLSSDFGSPSKIEKATNILRNFYNYIIAHDVAPDFDVHINAARALCNRARDELTGIHHLYNLLPGPFNTACSILYGSDREEVEAGYRSECGEGFRFTPAFSDAMARIIIEACIAAHGTEAQFEAALQNKSLNFAAEEVKTTAFEVVSITPASDEIQWLYASASKLAGTHLQPVGKLVLKPWVKPEFVEYDLPADLTPDDPSHPEYCPDQTYTLFVEDEILQHFHRSPLTTHRPVPPTSGKSKKSKFGPPVYTTDTEEVGTKLVAKIKKFRLGPASEVGQDPGADGICFLDRFSRIHPSFYTIIPNELMHGWKKPAHHWKLLEAFGLKENEVDENGQILPNPAEAQHVAAAGRVDAGNASNTRDTGRSGEGEEEDVEDEEDGYAKEDGAGVWGKPQGDGNGLIGGEDEELEDEDEDEKAFI